MYIAHLYFPLSQEIGKCQKGKTVAYSPSTHYPPNQKKSEIYKFSKCVPPKFIFPKCVFAKCTQLACLLSFAILL